MGGRRRIIGIKTLLVVDGHNLAYRAFFAVKGLSTRAGQPTNAVLGFLNMLLRAHEIVKPDYLVVAFDRPEPTFRHARFDQYKAHREKAPDEFRSQIPIIKEMLDVLAVPILEASGFEADDILGSLAHIAETTTTDIHTLLFTGDRDCLQLISDRTSVMLPQKGAELLIMNPENTVTMTGLQANQIVDFKALKGDASDNIPGVPGIGDKTATQLLQQFSTLDNLYLHLDEVKSDTLRNKLTQHVDLAYLSRELATIHIELPLELPLTPINIDLSRGRSFFETYELYGYLKKAGGPTPTTETLSTHTPLRPFTLLDDQAAWHRQLTTLPAETPLAFVPLIVDKQWLGFAVATSGESAFFVPLSSQSNSDDHAALGPMFSAEPTRSVFDGVWLATHPLIIHDFKRLLHDLPCEPPPLDNVFDIMLMDYLLAPDRLQHGVARLLKEYFREDLPPLASQEGTTTLACSLFRLYTVILPDLESKDLRPLYRDLDLALIPVLYQMEQRGIGVDPAWLKKLSIDYHAQALTLEGAIHGLAGAVFNVNSPKQLSHILFTELGLPVQHKTKTGASTDSDALEALLPLHPIAEKLLEYRQLTKLLNTYIDVLPTLMDTRQRIHTTFNVTVAATGRLSSSEPNLQNIPIRTELGERIRRAFVAQDGHTLVVADYSQIELRILAHLSGDENLIAAFLAGKDIHTATASTIFKIPYDEITPAIRRRAKEINFGIAYGMKAFGLAQRLGIPQKDAAAFIDTYFASFPKIQTILDATIQHVHDFGWVGTMLGRKRFFPMYATASKKDKQSLERMIINTPFQGSAADIIKAAMLAVETKLAPLHAKMILQIHDELIIECPPSEVDTVKAILKTEMEGVCSLVVPLTVNIGVGQNWLEAK